MSGLAALSTLSLVSTPLFVLLIGAEAAWARSRGRRYFDLRETVASLAAGAGEHAVSLVISVPLLAVYVAVSMLAPISLPATSVWTWVVAALAMDFLYYWYHRAAHQVSFIWALHVVHHQSRDFNFTVALRNSFFGKVVQLVFMLPLALIGVPVGVFAVVKAAMQLYMFWQHTRTIGKLGWIERIVVTPSSHRVHHALNPRYVNHNFGGLLVLWDHLFGTFQEEDEECRFEDVPEHPGYDPIRANLVGWTAIARRVRGAGSWSAALRAVFGPPVDPVESGSAGSRDPGPGRELQAYGYAQMAAVLPGLAIGHAALPQGALLLVITAVLAGLVVPTALVDGRPWALGAEYVRLVGLALAAVGAASLVGGPVAIATAAWALASMGALARIEDSSVIESRSCGS